MDPLSIATGATAVLTTVVKTTYQISKFIGEVRDASKDMTAVTRELDSLSAPLTQLSNNHDLVASMQDKSGLREVIYSCDTVLVDMGILMRKISTGRLSSVRWAMSGKGDMGQLRTHLEAYKTALVIVLNVHTASVTGQISRDVRFIPEMHEQIASLCKRLPRENFAIQRFLEDTAMYAESSYAGSVVDAAEYETQRVSDFPEAPTARSPAIDSSVPPDLRSPRRKEMPYKETSSSSAGDKTLPPPSTNYTTKKRQPPTPPAVAESGVSQPQSQQTASLPSRIPVDPQKSENNAAELLADAKEAAKRNREKLSPSARERLDKALYKTCEDPKKATLDNVMQLLKEGADPNTKFRLSRYWFALHAAIVHAPLTNVAKVLLQWGADINARGNSMGYEFPLHMLFARSDNEQVRFLSMLLSHGGANVNATSSPIGSALHAAMFYPAKFEDRRIHIADLLLMFGADVNLNNGIYGTPLHVAASRKLIAIARFLVEQGADLNARSPINRTPLDTAYASTAPGEDNPVIGFLEGLGAPRS